MHSRGSRPGATCKQYGVNTLTGHTMTCVSKALEAPRTTMQHQLLAVDFCGH